MRGNGPFTGDGYLFLYPAALPDQDLYLRLVIPSGYLISELIRDHCPTQDSAIGVGLSGGLWAESQVEFRDGRFEKDESFSGHSAGGTLAYYLRGPKIGGFLLLEGQIPGRAGLGLKTAKDRPLSWQQAPGRGCWNLLPLLVSAPVASSVRRACPATLRRA